MIRENAKAAAREAGTDYEPYSPHTVPEDLDLPLARYTGDGADGWHWAATFAFPEDEVPARKCSTGPPARISRRWARCRRSCRR